MKKLLLSITLVASAMGLNAQENILANKPIYTLGEAKTWTAGDASYTFITDDLAKLVQDPANTSNVFLYPENGTLNTPENQAYGPQGFYIDMESVQSVGVVTTTWEGAAGDSYEIYLTDSEPTLAILDEEPTYAVSGLGQYTSHTAVMPAGARGRYLVFQVTKATNYGWGVKIRSIAATAPVDDVLTSFSVSPGLVTALGQSVPVTFTCLNQLGLAIPAENVTITLVGDNAEYADGNLTVNSGNSATFSASMGDVTLECVVYVAPAPPVPDATLIKTPVFTNGVTSNNATVEWTTAYNDGAVNKGTVEFAEGTVAQYFTAVRCVFISNSVTTGAWNGNINPAAEGYRSFCLSLYSPVAAEGVVEFENVENLESGTTHPFTLNANEWTEVGVDVLGATKLGNLSVRFAEGAAAADLLITNVYFTPAYVEDDENAPVLSDINAEASMTSVTLSFSATEEENSVVYYTITVGDVSYNVSGTPGELVTYTIEGLNPSTEYEISVVASDGLNSSDPKTVKVKTLGLADSPEPSVSAETVVIIYSSHLGSTEAPQFDSWGSKGTFSFLTTENGNNVLSFNNYNGQWGGLVNLDVDTDGCLNLHIDVFADGEEGSFDLAPVWAEAEGDTPGTTVQVKNGEWTSYNFELSTFGYPDNGYEITQLAFTNSSLASFAADNIYLWSRGMDGVENVAVEGNSPQVYYNLQGIRVAQPVAGQIYIVNGKKVVLKF